MRSNVSHVIHRQYRAALDLLLEAEIHLYRARTDVGRCQQAGKRIQVIADKKGIIARSSRGDRRLIGVLQVRDGAAHDYSIDGCADGLTANLTGDVEAIRGGVHRTVWPRQVAGRT